MGEYKNNRESMGKQRAKAALAGHFLSAKTGEGGDFSLHERESMKHGLQLKN